MNEPPKLLAARQHLAQAETHYRSENGLFHLEEALTLLEEVMAADAPTLQIVARNLASTYADRICRSVQVLVEKDRGLPEPELEHFFRLMLAFDERGFELPAAARATKIALVRHLIDRYHEGHAPAAKAKALEQLAQIAAGEGPKKAKRPRARARRRP